jgi:membrane protein
VKPHHDLLHRQRQTHCSLGRGTRGEDVRAPEHKLTRNSREPSRNTLREPSAARGTNGAVADRGRRTDESLVTVAAREAPRPGNDPHGRTAEHPKEIPKRGWRDIAARLWQNLGRDNTSLVAAGIGLNALLAVFPGLAVVVSVYGMFSSPQDMARDLQPFLGILPQDAATLLIDQLQNMTAPASRTLGLGAIAGGIVALWNSRQGMSALMTATNIAYNQPERRGFLRQIAISLAFSAGAILIFAVMLGVGVAVPLILQAVPLGPDATVAVLVCRWVLLWLFAVLSFSLAYHYAPDRQPPKWRWVTWGSAIAATLWILGSLAFAAYVQNFGSYGKTYGALGGVIVLLMWFYLMGFTIVLGAEINAEMEHQTAVDTTEGPPAPMGHRGAYVADTLGRTSK